jgi:PAS domain S-box-containing protein
MSANATKAGPIAAPLPHGDPFDVVNILNSVLDTARGLIAADGYAIWLLEQDRDEWRVAASRGMSQEFASQVMSGHSEDMPESPICAEDVERVPLLGRRTSLYRSERIRSLMAVPLSVEQRRRGTLAFYFRSPHRFTPDEIELAGSLARLSSSAVAATELYREQSKAKARSDFLAGASAVLASSLNYEETLAAVAHLAVPHIADGCAVDLVEGNALKRVAVAHGDPEKARLVWEIANRYPTALNPNTGLGRVIALRRSELYPIIEDATLQRDARNEEHLAVLRKLNIRSSLLVPLMNREEALGIITLITGESGRILTEADLTLAEALASRAAVAIDNARLFTALRRSERNFRAVSETATCAIFIHDGAQVVYANRAASDIVGMRIGETHEMWDRIHPADREMVMARAAARLRGEPAPSRYEFRIIRPDSSVAWIDLSASAIDYAGRKAVLATAFDVTERRVAVELLQRREQEARTLLENLPDTISRFNRDLRYLYISPHIQRIAGRPADLCIGKTFEQLGYPAQLCELWNASLRRTFATGKPDSIEFGIAAPDGQMHHYVGTAVPEVTRDGMVESVMTITHDVTEQRVAVQQLRNSQAQLRLIIDSIPALVAYVDTEQRFRRVNRTFEQWFQAPLKSFLGRTIREVMGEQNYANLAPYIAQVLNGREVQYEATNQYADSIRNVLITYVPDLNDAQQVRGFVALVMDVTQRRVAEDALRKSEKLAAAGRLAASIAHEINNPLEAITNLLFLLQQEEQLSSMGQEYLSLAEQELSRVSQIATQTLRFHRRSAKALPINVEEVLEAVLTLYRPRLVKSGVVADLRYRKTVPVVAFEGELRQLFANLIANALDAMPEGGRLTLRTRPATRAGVQGVHVTVADSGFGIPEDLRAHIFEPFVTSKDATGTGLGLWVSKEIIEKHRGAVRVRSRNAAASQMQSSGTVFSIFLAGLDAT